MVDKANDIYNRWANGQELPTIVLRHITDESSALGDDHDLDRRSPATQPEDPFLYTHQSLAQCIAEVHQIAKTMFPLRKPCSCSVNRAAQQVATSAANGNGINGSGNGKRTSSGVAAGVNANTGAGVDGKTTSAAATNTMLRAECPPSHEWSPPPVVNASSPVLPEAPPVGFARNGSVVAVGYPVYGNVYSSLKGSGMSPSPSPGLYAKNAGANVNGAGVGSPTLVNAQGGAVPNGTTGVYHGYPNGGGMHGPPTGNNSAGYAKPGSPTYPKTTTPPTTITNGSSNRTVSPSGSRMGTGLYASVAVLPASAPPVSLPPTSSKLAIVDTINFELGALNASSDQSFMVFY